MRSWIVMFIIALSSVIFTACNKGGGSASTPNNCTQNAYGMWVDQNGATCTPGYNQYNCMNNMYTPPGGAIPYGGYPNGGYPYQQGGWAGGGNCSYINFQNTFPYNVQGYGQGCSYWNMVYPGNVYAPMNMGGNYVCVNMTSMGMAGMYGGGMMTGCIPGYNCGGGCRTSGAGFGVPGFWLGYNVGMCGF